LSEFLLNKYLLIAKVVVLLICHCEGKWHQFLEITNRSLVEERGGHLETGIILSTAGGALYQERKITIFEHWYPDIRTFEETCLWCISTSLCN